MPRLAWVGLLLFILVVLLAFVDFQVGRVAGSTSGFVFGQVRDEGTSLTVRPYLDFIGVGVTCADVVTSTQCTIPGGASHNLLSATHSDTTAGTVVRGDLVAGQGASPTWVRLALGLSGYVMRSDGTDALWAAIADADLPITIVRTSRTLTAGAGLSGGGDLSADRTIATASGTCGSPRSTRA